MKKSLSKLIWSVIVTFGLCFDNQSATAQSIPANEVLKHLSHNEEWAWVKVVTAEPLAKNESSVSGMQQDGWEITHGRSQVKSAGNNALSATMIFEEGRLMSIAQIVIAGNRTSAKAVETIKNSDAAVSQYHGSIVTVKSEDRRVHYVITLQNATTVIRLHNF